MHRRALKGESGSAGDAFRLIREDVSPLRLGNGLWGMVLITLALVAGVSVAFVLINHAALWLIPLALVPTLILGGILYFWLAYVDRFCGWLAARVGRLQAAFLLFFVYLPTFVALYFLFLAYPLGLALNSYASPELATDYQRWILDVSALAAMIAWGRLIRRKL